MTAHGRHVKGESRRRCASLCECRVAMWSSRARADQYLAGCWQSQESTKLCTRLRLRPPPLPPPPHHHHHHHHHLHHHHPHHRHHRRRRVEEAGGILGVTVLRPRRYHGDKLRKGTGARGGGESRIPCLLDCNF